MGSGIDVRGALAGLAGGALGMVTMQLVKRAAQRALDTEAQTGEPDSFSFVRNRHRRGEDATTAAGRIAFSTAFRREPGGREKEVTGQLAHWGYGLAMAAVYGALTRRTRGLGAELTSGALYGLGIWIAADELAVPLLGLGDRPRAVPAAVHLQALAAHLGYGAATAAGARAAYAAASRAKAGHSGPSATSGSTSGSRSFGPADRGVGIPRQRRPN